MTCSCFKMNFLVYFAAYSVYSPPPVGRAADYERVDKSTERPTDDVDYEAEGVAKL